MGKMGVNIRSVEDLDVFKMAHELVLRIYKITKKFPEEEKFGLISQMRRAVSSVPMNLMEGGHRLSSKEYRQFAGIANGSIGELKYHLLLSKDLHYISLDDYGELRNTAEEVSKMLMGLIKSLSRKK
jgi:four helix bundle protein